MTLNQLREVMLDRERDFYENSGRKVDRQTFHRKQANMVAATHEYFEAFKDTPEFQAELKREQYTNDFINNRGNFKTAHCLSIAFDL